MNWRLIFLLSTLSLFLAAGSILGLIESREWAAWLAVGAYSAWIVAGKVTENYFLHGFYLGIISGTLNSTAKAVFFGAYISHTPKMAETLAILPQDLSPPLVLLIMGPLMGAVSGVAFGILTVLASIARKHLRGATKSAPPL